MCQPAPVIDAYGASVAEKFGIPYTYNVPGPGGVFLGSVGDQAHSQRRSSHNCSGAPGGQESPVNGVAYAGQYAHAWDSRPASKEIGERLAAETLKDPRVRYVIYDNLGRYPNGDTWATDHPTFHVSMLPGTHDDTRPFFDTQSDDLTEEEVEAIVNAIKAQTDTLTGVIQRNATRQINTVKNQGVLTRAEIARQGGATEEAVREILAELVEED